MSGLFSFSIAARLSRLPAVVRLTIFEVAEHAVALGSHLRRGAAGLAAEQLAAAEILDREKGTLQIVPPDPRRNVVRRLPYRRRDLSQHGEAVIVVKRAPVVAGHAVRQKLRVVTIEQRPLGTTPAIGVPLQRHHIGEIVGADVDALKMTERGAAADAPWRTVPAGPTVWLRQHSGKQL